MRAQGLPWGKPKAQGRIKSARVEYEYTKWHLMMVSWRDLLNRLDQEPSIGDAVSSDINQLRGLTERMDEVAFRQLNEEDIRQELPHLLLTLTRLVDTVIDAYGVQEGLLKVEGYRASATFDGFVRYFEFVDSGVKAWFGFSYRRWSNQGVSPLWFGLQGPVANSQIDQDKYSAIIRDLPLTFDGLLDGSIPICLRTGADYQEVLNYVLEQLRSVESELTRYTAAT